MEFCNLGKHCHFCNQRDYLPFKCDDCKYYFCKDHRQRNDHKCKQKIKKLKKNKKKKTKCQKCKRMITYPLSSQCSLCYLNYCETHRLPEYHVCDKNNKIAKTCREEALSMEFIRKNYPQYIS